MSIQECRHYSTPMASSVSPCDQCWEELAMYPLLGTRLKVLEKEYIATKDKLAALEGALRKYGKHSDRCMEENIDNDDADLTNEASYVCTCGLDKALNPESK
jgi:hypothetical protein